MATVREKTLADGTKRFLALAFVDGKHKGVGTFGKRAAAMRAAEDAERDHRRSLHDPAYRLTVANALGEWSRLQPPRAHGTEQQQRYLTKRVTDALGTVRLADLTDAKVATFARQLESRLSASTARRTLQLLSAALQHQVDLGHLPRNIAKGVKFGRETRRTKRTFAPAEIDAIAAAMGGDDGLAVLILGYGGLRPGELSALLVSDFDTESGRLSITKANAEVQGKITTGPPKTDAGRRLVALPPKVADALRTHVQGMKPKQPLISSPEGAVWRRSSFNKRFQRQCAQMGIDGTVRAYDLRGSAMSLAFAKDATLPQVMRRFGHIDSRVALEIYAQSFQEEDDALASRL